MYTTVNVHNVDQVIIKDSKDWDTGAGRYQSMEITLLDKDGREVFSVTAFSDGLTFKNNNECDEDIL